VISDLISKGAAMPARTAISIGAPARLDIIRKLLATEFQLDLVGELSSAAGLSLIAALAPDIVILDCTAPQINPLVVLPQLRAHAPLIIALGASTTAGEHMLLRALGATAIAGLDEPGSLAEALAAAGVDRRPYAPARPAPRPRARGAADLTQRHSRHAQ
jgi:DNA-binding NarL/FixJ family response regulator